MLLGPVFPGCHPSRAGTGAAILRISKSERERTHVDSAAPALTRAMELRKLKALLGALRDAGVTSYRDEDVNVQFGAAPVLVPEGDVTGDPDDLRLPADVPDVARALANIRKQYEPKPGRAA